jgi:perosamine synthetase
MKQLQVFLPLIRSESIQATTEVLKSGWIGMGPKVKQFEENFQTYLGTINKCVAIMSATDGLELAVQLLDINTGDEVITTAITFVSTNHAILYNKATPVFADIDPQNGCLLASSIKSKITSKTKAILVVHLSGASADMEAIEKIAHDNNLAIIEDCAHAAGGYYKSGVNTGKKIGNSQNICVFSFQAVKNLPIGDGGMIVLSTDELYQKAQKLRWLGIDKDTYSRTAKTGEYLWKYDVPHVGIKSNLNDILGAIGVEQLKYLDSDNQRRREIAKFYKDNFKNIEGQGIRLPDIDLELSSCHFYPIFAKDRDKLMTFMRNKGISCGMHYIRNDRYATYVEENLPSAEWWSNHEITLPCHLLLTDDDLQYIVNSVKDFYQQQREAGNS